MATIGMMVPTATITTTTKNTVRAPSIMITNNSSNSRDDDRELDNIGREKRVRWEDPWSI